MPSGVSARSEVPGHEPVMAPTPFPGEPTEPGTGRAASRLPARAKRLLGILLKVPATIAIALIAMYRFVLSPWLPPSCRYLPTCSEYAADALRKHGFLRGSWLGARRILRCHPGHPGGYDPVP